MLHALAGGNRLTLTECRRSDKFLFDWYSSVAKGGSRHEQTLQQIVSDARVTFSISNAKGFIPGTMLAPTNLVLSHRLRKILNKKTLLQGLTIRRRRKRVRRIRTVLFASTGLLHRLATKLQTCLLRTGKKTHICCAILYLVLQMITLPRQARGKCRERTQKEIRFLQRASS